VYNNNPYNIMSVCIYNIIYVTTCVAKSNLQYGHCAMLRVLRSEKDRLARDVDDIGPLVERVRRLARKRCGQYIYYYNNSRMFKKNRRGIS